jgi:hypothetical protein
LRGIRPTQNRDRQGADVNALERRRAAELVGFDNAVLPKSAQQSPTFERVHFFLDGPGNPA